MKRYIIMLILLVVHLSVYAQDDGDFNPTTPGEPGVSAKVVLSVSPTSAGTTSGGGTYTVGKKVTLRTTAAGSQWRFLRWRNSSTEEIVSTSSSFTITTTEGISRYVAEYEELSTSTLTLECNPSEANASRSGAGTYVQGTRVYVYCYTPTGYAFSNWTNKRTGQVLSTSRYFYFTKSAEPDTLVANFTFSPSTPGEPSAPIVYRNVTIGVNMAEAGTVSTTSAQVVVGQTFTVSAYNKTNYAFLGWERDGAMVSTNATYSFTMPKSNVNLTAIFEFAPGTPEEPEMSDKQPSDNTPGEGENPGGGETPGGGEEGGGDGGEEEEPKEPSTIPGDVNGDYRVNVLDLSMLTGYIVHHLHYDSFIFENADINHDGRINAVDEALLIAIIIMNIQ